MRFDRKTYLRIGISVFLLYLAIRYWGAIARLIGLMFQAATPLIFGGAIAYIVNILMSFYERRFTLCKKTSSWVRGKRTICMLMAFISVLLIIVLLVWMIIPQLTSCIRVLLKALPSSMRSLYEWLDRTVDISAVIKEFKLQVPADADWENFIKELGGFLVNGFGGAMGSAISAVVYIAGSTVTLIIGVIFAMYILLSKEKLGKQFNKLIWRIFSPKVVIRITDIRILLDKCFHSYIVGQCIEALILGGLCAIGMVALQLPYAAMIGALIGASALIPIAGAWIGGAIGAIMIFSVSPVEALIFVVFLLVLQQIEGNLIYPRTVGFSLGLPPIWVLAAVTIGGGMLGITGMLLFVPLAAFAYEMLKRYVKAENKLNN